MSLLKKIKQEVAKSKDVNNNNSNNDNNNNNKTVSTSGSSNQSLTLKDREENGKYDIDELKKIGLFIKPKVTIPYILGKEDSAAVGGDPSGSLSVHVLDDFISIEQEEKMMEFLLSPYFKSSWIDIKHRKLMTLGGLPKAIVVEEEEEEEEGKDIDASNNSSTSTKTVVDKSKSTKKSVREPLPEWILPLIESLNWPCDRFPSPNHVLINQYKFDQGIDAHTDGPLYHPYVCCLSIGDDAVMTFKKRLQSSQIGIVEPEIMKSVTLKRRSLVIFEGDLAYLNCTHEVPPLIGRSRDAIRISLTIRHIKDQVKKRENETKTLQGMSN